MSVTTYQCNSGAICTLIQEPMLHIAVNSANGQSGTVCLIDSLQPGAYCLRRR